MGHFSRRSGHALGSAYLVKVTHETTKKQNKKCSLFSSCRSSERFLNTPFPFCVCVCLFVCAFFPWGITSYATKTTSCLLRLSLKQSTPRHLFFFPQLIVLVAPNQRRVQQVFDLRGCLDLLRHEQRKGASWGVIISKVGQGSSICRRLMKKDSPYYRRYFINFAFKPAIMKDFDTESWERRLKRPLSHVSPTSSPRLITCTILWACH